MRLAWIPTSGWSAEPTNGRLHELGVDVVEVRMAESFLGADPLRWVVAQHGLHKMQHEMQRGEVAGTFLASIYNIKRTSRRESPCASRVGRSSFSGFFLHLGNVGA